MAQSHLHPERRRDKWAGGPCGEGVMLAGPFRVLAAPRPDFSAGWGQQTAPRLCALWRLFAISLPGLPAKRPLASGAARQVQLRILTTAACVPRISSRPGRPQSALPVSPAPQLPPLLGAWRIGSSQTQTQEWILVSSTSLAHDGVNDKNNNDRESGQGSHTSTPARLSPRKDAPGPSTSLWAVPFPCASLTSEKRER